LFKVASEVFAEKGYRDTTVAEICRRAGSNVAAVDYHFGSKDDLYAAVWKNAFEETMAAYPPDGGLPGDPTAEERLHALVYSLLHRIMDNGRLGHAGQIVLREMPNPTNVIHHVRHDPIRPIRERTHQIIGTLFGPYANEQQLRFCELSVIHQCPAIGFRKGKGKLPPFSAGKQVTPELIDALAGHIKRFSLAGIKAVRRDIEAGLH